MHYGNIQPNPLESKVWLQANGQLKTYNSHTKQWGNMTSSSVPEEPTSQYEFVDLGLPSGTKWATTNLGAAKPEEYGLYFAWGETQGYEGITIDKQFTQDDYKFGTKDSLTKYNDADGLTVLELEDDAAYQSDNACRMPTKADFEELIANTTSTWETLNGINGRRLTSNTNSNSIFIPAAGGCYEGSADNVGSYNGLWSSSLNESNSSIAWYLLYYPDNVVMDNHLRYVGFSVRAVKSIN